MTQEENEMLDDAMHSKSMIFSSNLNINLISRYLLTILLQAHFTA